jgi:hypothetical protein
MLLGLGTLENIVFDNFSLKFQEALCWCVSNLRRG